MASSVGNAQAVDPGQAAFDELRSIYLPTV